MRCVCSPTHSRPRSGSRDLLTDVFSHVIFLVMRISVFISTFPGLLDACNNRRCTRLSWVVEPMTRDSCAVRKALELCVSLFRAGNLDEDATLSVRQEAGGRLNVSTLHANIM